MIRAAFILFCLGECARLAAQTPVAPKPDWLLDASSYKARVLHRADPAEVELNNGLVRRVFRTAPNAATVAFDNLATGESLLHSVRPEARLEID